LETISGTRFAGIDFESAGIRPGATDVPVQIGLAVMEGTEISSTFCSYIHTTSPITWKARAVHGISDAEVADAPHLTDLWPEISSRLKGAYVVAHGAGTEKRFLRHFPLHGFGPWVDTLELSRALAPGLDSYSLGSLCEGFQLTGIISSSVSNFRWHDALADTVASLVLLRYLIETFELGERPASSLTRPDTGRYHANRKFRNL